VYSDPLVALGGAWGVLSLKAATRWSIPVLFELAIAGFVLLQALVDRRDPKLVKAPQRSDDDTMEFK